jgi:hypothetical protein
MAGSGWSTRQALPKSFSMSDRMAPCVRPAPSARPANSSTDWCFRRRLREVNRAIEGTAWGAFRTEIYATYDFRAVAREQRQGNLTLAAPDDI